MVSQLFSDIERLKTEIRRLRGRLDSIAVGSVVLSSPAPSPMPSPLQGAMIRGNSTPGWERLVISVPAVNVRNVVGVDNGETLPSWKTALDATNPTTIAAGDAAAPGTSLIFSHRDHRHGAPTTFPPGAGYLQLIVSILSDGDLHAWSDIPAALTELFSEDYHRNQVVLTNFTRARLVVNVETAGPAGSKLRGQYFDGGAWDYLDGVSGPSVTIDATGLLVSSWVSLEAGAKADVPLRIIGIDGDGAGDPEFGLMGLQFDNT